jgi:lysozyme family protein
MSNFQQSLLWTFKHEGILSNDPHDHGGITKYGISLRFLKLADEDLNGDGHVDEKDILSIDIDAATDLYREYFWDHYKCGEIDSLTLSSKIFDCFVNMRGKTAAKIFQKALRSCSVWVAADGIIGPKTRKELNAIMVRTDGQAEVFLGHCCSQQRNVYSRIIKNDSTQAIYKNGWFKRAGDLLTLTND